MAQKVVFILSTEFAGSTALGLVLGAHPRGVFIGEPANVIDRENPAICAICSRMGHPCPVWNADMVSLVRREPAGVYGAFANLHPDADYLVDSSKYVEWLDQVRPRGPIAPLIVHISKPVESYLSSLLVRKSAHRILEWTGIRWARANQRIRDYARAHGLPYLHVGYPDFVTRFETTLEELGKFVGFTPRAEQKEFWNTPRCYALGNPGTVTHFFGAEATRSLRGANAELYEKNHRKLFLDEKWKTLLTPRQIDRLYAVSEIRRESAVLGYSHPLASGEAGLALRLRAYALSGLFRGARWLKGTTIVNRRAG